MTAPSEPGHSGLRPLSPHGEGYCTVCHFIEGLTPDGLIERHSAHRSGLGGYPVQQECDGSFKRPPKLTPHRSNLAAFKTAAGKGTCPVCSKDVRVTSDRRLEGHYGLGPAQVPCPGGWKLFRRIKGRDHMDRG